jgi:hypothetical protein
MIDTAQTQSQRAVDLKIPVMVQIGRKLHALLPEVSFEWLRASLEFQLRLLLRQLGLAGTPVVEARHADIERVLHIIVHGRSHAFPPRLIQRVWTALTPQPPPDEEKHGDVYFADWLTLHLKPNAATADKSALPAPAEFLARLAVEAIRLRPSCLVGEAQAERFAQDCAVFYPNTANGTAWRPVLQKLLEMGVAATDKERIAPLLGTDAAADTLEPDVFEPIYNRLRAQQVELHIHPNYFSDLVPAEAAAFLNVMPQNTPARQQPTTSQASRGNDTASGEPFDASKPLPEARMPVSSSEADLLNMLRDGLFYELGLVVPPIVFVLKERVAYGMFVVRINDRVTLPQVGLAPGEVLMNETPQKLRQSGIEATRVARNPASDRMCSVVPAGVEKQLKGVTVWQPFGFIVLAIAAECRACAGLLLSAEDVECQLARLEEAFPTLVHAALARYAPAQLTAVLRRLLTEGVSIRNMPALLDRLLQVDLVVADERELILFDDRLPVPVPVADQRPTTVDACEFVRHGLKDQLSHQHTRGESTLKVLLLSKSLEAKLVASRFALDGATAPTPLRDDEADALRKAVWAQLALLEPGALKPALLTASVERPALRAVLEPEFPELAVLSYGELARELNIQPIGRVDVLQPTTDGTVYP